tara:strand:- start:333 stop:755 length:423 start_codon:yes stop_codon:yes gene_type:complete
MAHFAKIGVGNKVETVIVVDNDIAVTEQAGIDFIKTLYPRDPSVWKQCSFNTHGGKYYKPGSQSELDEDQSKAFRKNMAAIDGTYDPQRDAFIPIKPYPSWVLIEETCLWQSPIGDRPDDGGIYDWNEDTKQWDNRSVEE